MYKIIYQVFSILIKIEEITTSPSSLIMKHNPVHTPCPRLSPVLTPEPLNLSVKFSNYELTEISKNYQIEEGRKYPSKTFTITLIDSKQISVTIPLHPSRAVTYQLLKLAISQQTGYDSVSQQLYCDENPIDKTSDFPSLAENLILLVAGEARVKITPPEYTVRRAINRYNNFLTDLKVCYNKIHPNIESGNVYRHLNPSSGILKVIGVEDGYLKVDLPELDSWQKDIYHQAYYDQPEIKAWIRLEEWMTPE